MSAKRTGRNQLTITQHTLDAFPGFNTYEVAIENGRILLTPVSMPSEEELDRHFARLSLTEQDVTDAVAWARDEARKEIQENHANCD